MAKPTAVAEAPAEAKKRGVPKGTKREAKWNTFTVKYAKDAKDFDPQGALTALAENLALHVSYGEGKNRENQPNGKFTLTVGTAPIVKRAKAVLTKDDEKNALALFKAALRDPEKAPKINALAKRSEAGEDTSAEMSALIGLSK